MSSTSSGDENMAVLREFVAKSGKRLILRTLERGDLGGLLKFVNMLSREDTFVGFSGEKVTRKFEEKWLKGRLDEQRKGTGIVVVAVDGKKIVGTCGMFRGRLKKRGMHRGEVGVMIRKEYRGRGIGTAMFEEVVKKAREWKLRLLVLSAFADNEKALGLYRKMGFRECGRIPGALFRKGKYSDEIWLWKPLKGG